MAVVADDRVVARRSPGIAASRPLVTIVINNHNYGRFLSDAIESALGQSYARVEVVVVDDGSTDSSREVIEHFAGRVVPVFKANEGQAAALNAGFSASHGEIVIFLDADDRLHAHIVERVVDAFRADSSVAKVQYRMEVIDSSGRPTGEIKPPLSWPLPSGDLRRHVLAFSDDLTWMATSGNAFAADALRQIFPIPAADYAPVGADWYLRHLAALIGSVVSLDDAGADYRVHDTNNYEIAGSTIDLNQIRQSSKYGFTTQRHIAALARRLGLPGARANRVYSVSNIANRMVSLKLDPTRHPIAGDTVLRLWIHGTRAALRRFDSPWSKRLIWVLWFGMMVPAPKSAARHLAELFFLQEKRGRFNRVLQTLGITR